MKLVKMLLLPFVLVSTMASAADGSWAESKYNSLSSPELGVEFWNANGRVLGVGTMQKDDGDNFCRKTTVVYPGAQPGYVCYTQDLAGPAAKARYESIQQTGTSATFYLNGAPRVGGSWQEKRVYDTAANEIEICVETAAIVPHPVPTYRCYTSERPVGGAVSVGN